MNLTAPNASSLNAMLHLLPAALLHLAKTSNNLSLNHNLLHMGYALTLPTTFLRDVTPLHLGLSKHQPHNPAPAAPVASS